MRAENMLEKLATHDVQDVSKLFSPDDKCARAAEGLVWHSQLVPAAGKAGKPKSVVAAQSSYKNRNRKKKKADSNNKQLAEAPTAATAMANGGHGPDDQRPR
jgi:hypothetical protein